MKKGVKLAADSLDHIAKNADNWNDEIKKINKWNKAYDHNGRLKAGAEELPDTFEDYDIEGEDEEQDIDEEFQDQDNYS